MQFQWKKHNSSWTRILLLCDISPYLTFEDLEYMLNNEGVRDGNIINALVFLDTYQGEQEISTKYTDYRDELRDNSNGAKVPKFGDLTLEQIIEFDTTGKIAEFERMLP